jgi:hypothetical protein
VDDSLKGKGLVVQERNDPWPSGLRQSSLVRVYALMGLNAVQAMVTESYALSRKP